MKIILIHKDEFPKRPPVISSTLTLAELGHNVTLVTEGINDYWKEKLHNHKIEAKVIANKYKKYGTFGKVLAYRNFKKELFKIAEEERKQHGSVLLWIEGAQTIVALGSKVNEYPHILQIQELHERSKMQLKAISKVIKTAEAVFMPEYNRTVLYKVWFNLEKRPTVLPNKPYVVPDRKELEGLKEKIFNKYPELNNKKIILYQGLIDKDRDLSNFIKAVKELGEEYKFVMVGKDGGMVEHYKKIDSKILHIDFMPVPDYFVFTANAYVGILSYDSRILNNAYCAPNKIYEYGYFALPMIGNDIPGLRYTVETGNAGIIIDEEDVASIKNAIMEIDANYKKYSKSSRELFEKCDNRKTIYETLKHISK